MPQELAPYHRKKDEMTIHDGCLFWGKRVIVSRKLHSKLLEELEGYTWAMSNESTRQEFHLVTRA